MLRTDEIILEVFGYEPSVYIQSSSNISSGKTYSLEAYPIIFLRACRDYNIKSNFKINLSNQFKVVRLFEKAITWFDKYDDLFIQTKEGLRFNIDYADTRATLRDTKRNDKQTLDLYPIVVSYETSDFLEEGLMIRINETNTALINLDTVYIIYNIIKNFSFQVELLVMLSLFDIEAKEYNWFNKGGK